MSLCVCSTTDEECVPSTVTQGERVEWSKSFSGYPSAEWDLEYRFRGPGEGLIIDADAADDDIGYEMEMYAVAPAFDVVGTYHWQAWLTEIADTDNTFIIENGTIEVLQGFDSVTTDDIDLRSAAKIALDTIDAAMLAFATSDVMEYEISTPAGSRRVKRSDKAQLTTLRKQYAMIVSMERTRDRIRNGGSVMRSVPISMREC